MQLPVYDMPDTYCLCCGVLQGCFHLLILYHFFLTYLTHFYLTPFFPIHFLHRGIFMKFLWLAFFLVNIHDIMQIISNNNNNI